MLNECIIALWGNVRPELDENVIPRVGPLSVLQENEKRWSAAPAHVAYFNSAVYSRIGVAGDAV